MKKCGRCKIDKDLSLFCKNKRSKDGYNWVCKSCVSQDTTKESFKEKRRLYLKSKRTKRKKLNDIQKTNKAKYDAVYRQINKAKLKEQKREWQRKKKNDPIFRIKNNLRRRINHLVSSGYKSAHTFELIGCTAEEFKKHIESQFTEGMSWDNYGRWHIDHIIECHRFDLTKPEEQRKCFHYSNQRPLWAIDNLSRKKS